MAVGTLEESQLRLLANPEYAQGDKTQKVNQQIRGYAHQGMDQSGFGLDSVIIGNIQLE